MYVEFDGLLDTIIEQSFTSWETKMAKWTEQQQSGVVDIESVPPTVPSTPIKDVVCVIDLSGEITMTDKPAKKNSPPQLKIVWTNELRALIFQLVQSEWLLFAMLYRWKDIADVAPASTKIQRSADEFAPKWNPVVDTAVPIPVHSLTVATDPKHIRRLVAEQMCEIVEPHTLAYMEQNLLAFNTASISEKHNWTTKADFVRQHTARVKEGSAVDIILRQPVFGMDVASAAAALEKADLKKSASVKVEAAVETTIAQDAQK